MDASALIQAGDQLRAAICREMHKRKLELEPFVGPVPVYVRHMEQRGVWGGMPSLV